MPVLRQSVLDLVVVALVGDVDVHAYTRMGGPFKRAHSDGHCAFSIGSQKSEEPQILQNPRCTFSEERNQVRFSAPTILKDERATSVETQK